MMETIDGGANYLKLIQDGVHLNLNSALCSLVTPPRRTIIKADRQQNPVDISSQSVRFVTSPSYKGNQQLSKSLPKGSGSNLTRNSPSRMSPSGQCDGKVVGFYAGAKFGERPPPTELPKPPNHWVDMGCKDKKLSGSKEQSCIEMTNILKVLLKVQS